MRYLFLLTLLIAPTLCAEQSEAKKTDPAPTAVEEETVLTPFGRVKKQAPAPTPKPRPGAARSMVDVEIVNGVATFKRKTPFGVQSWKRPMDQLSADEKKLIEQSREAAEPAAEPRAEPAAIPTAKPAAKAPAAKPKPELVILEPR